MQRWLWTLSITCIPCHPLKVTHRSRKFLVKFNESFSYKIHFFVELIKIERMLANLSRFVLRLLCLRHDVSIFFECVAQLRWNFYYLFLITIETIPENFSILAFAKFKLKKLKSWAIFRKPMKGRPAIRNGNFWKLPEQTFVSIDISIRKNQNIYNIRLGAQLAT